MLPTPQPDSLSSKYPEPLAFREADLRLILQFPCLAALGINPLFAVNLSVPAFWLAVHWEK